jgi:hypothetical protein
VERKVVETLDKDGLKYSEEDVFQVLDAAACALRPEELFSEEDLCEWAFRNGFIVD